MSDQVLIALLSLLSGGGIVSAFVAWRKSKSEMKVLDSQGAVNVVKALNDGILAMSAMTNELEKQNRVLLVTNQTFEKRIEELETGRVLRTQQIEIEKKAWDEKIEAMEAHIAALTSRIEKDTVETQSLRDEIGILHSQVVELQSKNDRYARINQKLIKALEDAKIPMPNFDGDLTDTVDKWKYQK